MSDYTADSVPGQNVNQWPSAHRPSRCPDCGKTYKTMSGILAHLRTHKGDACLVYDDGTACRDHLPQPVWCANCTHNTTPGGTVMSAPNSAERDETLDWLMDAPSETGHAFWGMDPSGFCTCRDCNPTRPLPPGD